MLRDGVEAAEGPAEKPSTRGARRALTKTEILDAARRLCQEDGAGMPSMRRLAAALDVSPMALYRHVSDKDEILLGLADTLLAAQALPASPSTWQDYLQGIALLLRALLQAEPIVLEIFLRRPVTSPAAQQRLASAVAVLVRAGFDETRATHAYAAVHTYTLGFCALEHARNVNGRRGAAPDSRTAESERIAEFVTDTQFRFGLDAMLAGITP